MAGELVCFQQMDRIKLIPNGMKHKNNSQNEDIDDCRVLRQELMDA